MEPRFPHQPQAERVLSGDRSAPSSTRKFSETQVPPGGPNSHRDHECAGVLHEVRLALELQGLRGTCPEHLPVATVHRNLKSERTRPGTEGGRRGTGFSLCRWAPCRGEGRSRVSEGTAHPSSTGARGWTLCVPRDTYSGHTTAQRAQLPCT